MQSSRNEDDRVRRGPVLPIRSPNVSQTERRHGGIQLFYERGGGRPSLIAALSMYAAVRTEDGAISSDAQLTPRRMTSMGERASLSLGRRGGMNEPFGAGGAVHRATIFARHANSSERQTCNTGDDKLLARLLNRARQEGARSV